MVQNIFSSNTKKVSHLKIIKKFGPNLLMISWFLRQDFAKMVHFSENDFSEIYKYLNCLVLCVQFFDSRFSLDYSWGQYLILNKKVTKRRTEKSLTNNENWDICKFQKTFGMTFLVFLNIFCSISIYQKKFCR